MNAGASFWAPAPPRRPAQSCKALLPAHVARLLTFTALAMFGGLHWARLVAPTANGALLTMLAASLATAAVLLALARRRPSGRLRAATMLLAAGVLGLVALATAGVPNRFFSDPHQWDNLVAGIAHGLGAVPSVRVPYEGLDAWTEIVMVLGGSALVGVAALLAFAPRRNGTVGYPVGAAVALATLYAVAIIQRRPDRPFLAGLAFALLLALFLWLERVERRSVTLAAGAVAGALLVALVAAPSLNADRALLDYEEIAQSLSESATQYDWDHRYGPLNWPRDGREVLRVRAPARSYWKAVSLAGFDGRRWARTTEREASPKALRIADPGWLATIRVTVRALRSTQFVAAGTTLAISNSPREITVSAPGRFETLGQPLRRGDDYRARVYVPRPTAAQMRAAGSAYPDELQADYGAIGLGPAPRSGDQRFVAVPFWGAAEASSQTSERNAILGASPYARTYELAQRLRAQSASPYEYMRAIERHLRRGFAYTERPQPSAVPLEGFLFGDRAGYCQQFSGAMALLLRMGGIPARVAAGFSPGILNPQRREYVVRDVDAHSWVEVYFPQIGWVTRDPTPAVAPARSQIPDLADAGVGAAVTIGGTPERAPAASADRGGAQAPGAAAGDQGSPVPVEAIVALGLLLAIAPALVIQARRRRRTPTGEDDIAELRRALRRSGRDPQPQLTLDALAQRFAGTVGESYVRRLAAARYGYGDERPTRAQRAGLRRELAAGLGLRGHLRAWWALPPRARRGRR